MRTFYFLRHGQTDWNVEGRMQGHTDIPLNAKGIEQALKAAEHYVQNPIDRIISSPQVRAHVTAQKIADRLSIPLETDVRLMERHMGSLEGFTQDEIDLADPALLYDSDQINDWYPELPMPKGGETRVQVADRAVAAILDNLSKYPEKKLLFVAHGAWFRALMHKLCGEYIYSDNATPYIFSPPIQPSDNWLVKLAVPSSNQ